MIKIRNIKKSYNDGNKERTVLSSLSLDISNGEKVAIVGKSGSGKSTLMNSIIGSVYTDEGTIEVDGTSYDKKADFMSEMRNEKFGVVYQRDYLFTEFTAIENIIIAQNIKGYEDRDEAHEIIKKLELTEVRDNYPAGLSGGERQRVSIGRAMVSNPKIVIADEPTGSLDEKLATKTVDILLKLDATVIMVTHDLELAQKFDRIISLENGKVNN